MFNYALRVWPWGAASYSLSPASCTSQAPRRHSAGPKAQDHLRSAADSDLDSDSDLTRPLMLSTRSALKKKNLISSSPSWSKISIVVNPGVWTAIYPTIWSGLTVLSVEVRTFTVVVNSVTGFGSTHQSPDIDQLAIHCINTRQCAQATMSILQIIGKHEADIGPRLSNLNRLSSIYHLG